MATSDKPKTEAVPSPADEKWVFLQDGGDVAKELLLEEQDGDAIGEKESLENAVDGQENALDVGKFLCWCHSAWKDVSVRNDIWDDMRPYVLGVAVSLNTVLHLLTEVAAHGEYTALHILFTCLGNFTTAVVCAAVFSYATRFISLLATKASVVKKLEVNALLFGLVAINALILLTACCACLYEVITGLKVSSLTRRWKYFARYLDLLVDVVRGPILMGAVVLSPSLVLLMKTDVVATFHTFVLHWRETKEARKLFAKRLLYLLIDRVLESFVLVSLTLVAAVFVVIPVVFGARLIKAASEASGGL